MSKVKKQLNIDELEKGVVFYTDGGARPNPGYGGYGIHGYVYHDKPELDKKSTGLTNHVLTDNGYVEKSIDNQYKIVKPIMYIDQIGSFKNQMSNNLTELLAANQAIKYANTLDIKNVTILSDSDYVVKGTNTFLNKWKENNFYKLDGSPVSNRDIWQEYYNNLQTLKNKNINYNIQWIEAHCGHLGNEKADENATIGVFKSKSYSDYNPQNKKIEDIIETNIDEDTSNYWNAKHERHPFLINEIVYIFSKKELNIPGKYFLGRPGNKDSKIEKELAMEGKKNVDSLISYIELVQPDPILEKIINKQSQYFNGYNIICRVNIRNLFKNNIINNLLLHDDICITRKKENKLDLFYLGSDKNPITRGLEPPKVSKRTIEAINVLKGILKSWENKNDTNIFETDITNQLYSLDEKNNLKLNTDITNATIYLPVNICYDTDRQIKINLYFNYDLPDRNIFKKIEKENPKIYILAIKENEKTLHYSLVIKTDSGTGIWGTFCSSKIFIK